MQSGSDGGEYQQIAVDSIDEQPIRLDVQFAVTVIIAFERVVTQCRGEVRLRLKKLERNLEFL